MNKRKLLIAILLITLTVFILGGFITSHYPTEDQERIERWIQVNRLNEYGDPRDVGYIGGTPLYDESTDIRTDKYDYIRDSHPEEPWNGWYWGWLR